MANAFAKIKLFAFNLKNLTSKTAHKIAGTTASFKCSHVLSFTAENIPKNQNRLNQLKVKCSKLPKMEIKTIPSISNLRILEIIAFWKISATKSCPILQYEKQNIYYPIPPTSMPNLFLLCANLSKLKPKQTMKFQLRLKPS